MYIGIDLLVSEKSEEQVGHYLFEGISRVGRYNINGVEDMLGDVLIYSGNSEDVENAVSKLEDMRVSYLTSETIDGIFGS